MSLTGSADSRQAIGQLRSDLERVAGQQDGSALSTMARELYAVVGLLADQPRLRRTIGDPSSPADQRADLIGRLLDGRVGAAALELVQAAVRLRWSTSWDLADGLGEVADEALFAAAEKQGRLDDVEDELFRFSRILAVQSQLTTLLDELSVPAQRRVELLRSVIGGKVQPATEQLLEHAVTSSRERSIELAIDHLLDAAARRRERSIARVLSAVALSEEQESRLASVLSSMYGRAISVRSAVDPTVVGGLMIRVGDEVIDGTVATRIATARAQLAG